MAFSFKYKTLRKFLNLIAYLMMLLGVMGSFGLSMASSWIPPAYELPVGNAENVLVTKNNTYIVPLPRRGKIQIYNENKKIITGWYVNIGQKFKVLPISDNIFKVVGNGIKYYDITGKQLSSDEAYSISKDQDRARIEEKLYIPTPFYLLPFTGFIRSTIFAFVGIMLLTINGEFKLGFFIFLKDLKRSFKGE